MKDLLRNRARTILTLSGIIIGSGSIVALASLLHGAREALVRLNQGVNESDTLRIMRDEVDAKHAGRFVRPLSQSDGEALASSPQLDGVGVTVEARRETTAYRGDKQKRVKLMGAGLDALEMYRLKVARGRFLVEDDLIAGGRVAVIGHEVHKELGVPLGAQLTIDDETWTVVGVLEHKPVMGHGNGTWQWDRRVLVPRTAFDATFSPGHEVHSIFMKVNRRPVTEKLLGSLSAVAERIVLRRHGGVKNFKAQDRKEGNMENLILTIIQVLLLATALMSMFVGGINIMNIMLVTVTERTREIGIRRAVGASPRAILAQFLAEATAISALGGVLGIAGGASISWLASLGLAHAFGKFELEIIPWSIALGLGLSLLTGVVFGLLPAHRASRLNPIEALRYE